jgi:hypothetical protein
LRTCLGFFAFVVQIFLSEAEAAKLHRRSVDGMISWHNNGLLLIFDTTLVARAPRRS